MVRDPYVFNILTWKCASCHNGVPFCDIRTSKTDRTLVCFVNFDFKICFAPQRRAILRHPNFEKWSELVCFVNFDFKICFVPQQRAIFRHPNFQMWSDAGVFCTCWLKHVALRHSGVPFFDILSSKNGPRPSVWHFDLQMCFAPERLAIFHFSSAHGSTPAALASLLFDPPDPQIIGKTPCFATFLTFRAPVFSFF